MSYGRSIPPNAPYSNFTLWSPDPYQSQPQPTSLTEDAAQPVESGLRRSTSTGGGFYAHDFDQNSLDPALVFTSSECEQLRQQSLMTSHDLPPYWQSQIENSCWDIDATGTMSFRKQPAAASPPKEPCRECGKAFTRAADLARHEAKVHGTPMEDVFRCDYPKCSRRKSPFGRKDHFRDHLRMYHNEDVRGRTSGSVDNARVTDGWWRCSRCLARVDSASNGWTCSCGAEIEESRKVARGY